MNGVLVIDKPSGMTSHDVVARVRRILGERRIGHTGTLDPFATGVLVLLVGQATRLAQFLTAADKEYEAVIRLGFATDTGDREGKEIPGSRLEAPVIISEPEIENALNNLRGEILQLPPMYSAKKVKGKKLYEHARRGEEITRTPSLVTIFKFEKIGSEQLRWDAVQKTADLRVQVVCSSGTYVRTLAGELGRLLGTSAHLAELRRIRAGDFLLTDAIGLERLQHTFEDGSTIRTILKPPEAALSHMGFVHLSDREVRRARNGLAVQVDPNSSLEGSMFGMKDKQENLIGIGYYSANDQLLHPRIVFSSKNID
jgi:tRNA pseudouridine55 synthase